MKRIILCLLTLSFGLCVTANDDPHLKRLIECINDSDFVCATEELLLVENWKYQNREETLVDITKALVFTDTENPVKMPISLLDSLLLNVVAVECNERCYELYTQNKFSKALFYMEMVSDLQKRVLGENHPDYAISLNNLGFLYMQVSNYREAEQCYIKSLSLNINILGERHPIITSLLNNLGLFYYRLGDYYKSEQYYLKTLELAKIVLGEKHENYAVFLNHLGLLYYRLGDYQAAEQYYLKAQDIYKTCLGEDNPDYITSLINIGALCLQIGDYHRAAQYYLQALEKSECNGGGPSSSLATLLNNLGHLYSIIGDYSKSEQYYLEALEMTKNVLGENHPNYARSLSNIGHLYFSLGDIDKAQKYYLQALEIRKNLFGENHPDYAISLNNLGVFFLKIGDYTKAEQYHLQALDIRKKILRENHPDYLLSLTNLGTLYLDDGNYSQVELYYNEARNIHKSQFLQSLQFMSEHQRKTYWNTLKELYELLYPRFVYYYHDKKPVIASFSYDNELFSKGLLLNSSNEITNSIQESGDSVLISRWNELTTKKQQIIVLEDKSSQSEYVAQLREQAEQLEKEITRTSAAYRENTRQWNLTWDSVRTHLARKQVAIEYMVAPLNADSTMYCALLLRKNSKYPKLIPLFEEKEVSSLLNTSTEGKTNGTYSFDGNGQALQQLIWSKILPYVKQGETIYFAPSGVLHQVAIEALPFDETHTMGDKFNLVRLSSTREIVLNKSNDTHTTASLYGGIHYDMTGEELLAESEQYFSSSLLASRGIENDTLDRGSVNYLPGTKKEVESIDKMLKDNHLSVQLFTATNANEESFKALSGKHQNILHIATHGFYWSDSTAQKKDYFSQRAQRMDDNQPTLPALDPLNRCGLLFAGANTALSGHSADLPEGVQDGILTAKEISLLDLRDADLVVLSACETGKGEITGEGVFGLQRAFKQAGAQTIIMSLWPVNDAATQMLMTEFYRNWITNHQPKREAFRNAQNTVRTQFEEPVYWAGFIMLD